MAKTLKLKDWFTAPGADFNASPVVFQLQETRISIVATANDGRHCTCSTALRSAVADHKTPLHVTPKYTAAGVTTGPGDLGGSGHPLDSRAVRRRRPHRR